MISVVGFGGLGFLVVVVVGRGEVVGRFGSAIGKEKFVRIVRFLVNRSNHYIYLVLHHYCIERLLANHNDYYQHSNVIQPHIVDLAIDHVRIPDMNCSRRDVPGNVRYKVHCWQPLTLLLAQLVFVLLMALLAPRSFQRQLLHFHHVEHLRQLSKSHFFMSHLLLYIQLVME